jgi:hypothetical protein
MVKLFALLFLTLVILPTDSNAQSTDLSASVGKYYFSASGIVSPFASVVMTSDSVFLASTVADKKGNFTLRNAFVNEGFSKFCLEAIDMKRIGSSYTCFEIEPLASDGSKDEIFLPPTIGFSGKKINPGSSVTASGYSMPNSEVEINISESIKINIRADKTGYYKTEIREIPSGKYNVYGVSEYQSRKSLEPSRKVLIESVSYGSILRQRLGVVLLGVFLILVLILLILVFLSRKFRERVRRLIPARRKVRKKKG